jgi:hypothetical protein
LQCFGQRYAVISELANVLSPVVLKLERRQRDETRAQDEPSDQDPDRVILPQLRKKSAPEQGRLSRCFARRQSAPFRQQDNTILVNREAALCRGTVFFAPQHATF